MTHFRLSDRQMVNLPDLIRVLSQENKQLRSENEELKENIADMEQSSKMMKENIKEGGEMYGLMKEEDAKKEIEKLKKKCDDLELEHTAKCAEFGYLLGDSISFDDMDDFDNWLKKEYPEKWYKKLYEYFDMADWFAPEDE